MLKSAALLKHQYCVSLFGPTLPAKLSGCPMFKVEIKAKPFSDIPGPKGIYQWPLIGTLVLYKPFTKYTPETLSDLLNAMHDKYGPVLKLRLGPQVVVVSDPEDIENVYQNEGKYPVRHGLDLIHTYNRRNNYTDSLSQLQGPEWHALRVLINKRLLKVDSALHYLEQQNKVADDFVRALQTEKLSPEDIEDLFFRFASESIALVTFNKRLGLFDQNPDKDSLEFLEAMKSCLLMIQRAISGKSLTHKWWRNSTYRTFETNRNILQRISSEHVNEAKALSGTFSEEEPNLLFSLLSEKGISNETVTNLMMSLYTGGTDSTAKNSQVFLLNLAQNPDKQELLRREILDVLGPDGPLTAKTLSKLVYLKAALKESFSEDQNTNGISNKTDNATSSVHIDTSAPLITSFQNAHTSSPLQNYDSYQKMRSPPRDKFTPHRPNRTPTENRIRLDDLPSTPANGSTASVSPRDIRFSSEERKMPGVSSNKSDVVAPSGSSSLTPQSTSSLRHLVQDLLSEQFQEHHKHLKSEIRAMLGQTRETDQPRSVGSTQVDSPEMYHAEFIRNLIREEMDDLKDYIHKEFWSVQVEVIKQAFQLQRQMQAGFAECLINPILLDEIDRLKEENARLRKTF